MSRFTLDTASEFLFGRCMHALSGDLPFPHNATAHPYASTLSPGSGTKEAAGTSRFAQAFLDAQMFVATRDRYGWIWPLTELWEDKAKKPMKVVNAYLAPIIQDAIRKREGGMAKAEEVKDGEDEGTMIDHLVGLTSGQ